MGGLSLIENVNGNCLKKGYPRERFKMALSRTITLTEKARAALDEEKYDRWCRHLSQLKDSLFNCEAWAEEHGWDGMHMNYVQKTRIYIRDTERLVRKYENRLIDNPESRWLPF